MVPQGWGCDRAPFLRLCFCLPILEAFLLPIYHGFDRRRDFLFGPPLRAGAPLVFGKRVGSDKGLDAIWFRGRRRSRAAALSTSGSCGFLAMEPSSRSRPTFSSSFTIMSLTICTAWNGSLLLLLLLLLLEAPFGAPIKKSCIRFNGAGAQQTEAKSTHRE